MWIAHLMDGLGLWAERIGKGTETDRQIYTERLGEGEGEKATETIETDTHTEGKRDREEEREN